MTEETRDYTARGGGEKAKARAGKGISCRSYCLAEEGIDGLVKPGDGCHQRELEKGSFT